MMFACDCCERETCARKKPGLGYLCDPCVKCFTADPPLTGDEPLPPGVTCYFVEDLAWMQAQVGTTVYYQDALAEARRKTPGQIINEKAARAYDLVKAAKRAEDLGDRARAADLHEQARKVWA